MAKKINVLLYDGGQVVQSYDDVEIVKTANSSLVFKVKEKVLSVKGKEHDRVITRTFTTTLPSLIEEVIEHSGLISV